MTDRYAIVQGDVLATLRALPSDSFDGCLTDPPYGFRFMNKAWDYDVPSVDVWRELLRVLKPGAALLSFAGARTAHRIACGIEDAGFEIRDVLHWLYGKGFPKSQNVSLAIDNAAGAERPVTGTRVLTGNAAMSTAEKGGTYGVQVGSVGSKTIQTTGPATELAAAWEGYGTALKPAYEPITLARKPLDGTMAANVARWGVGGLAIDACRVEAPGETTRRKNTAEMGSNGGNLAASYETGSDAGRHPANLILDEEAGAMLDASVAPSKSTPYPEHAAPGAVLPLNKRTAGGYSDAGGPSRFFYSAKVSTKEREAGCEHLVRKSAAEMVEREDGQVGLENPRAGAGRTGGAHNHHPTLKPIALNKWLASLIRPPTHGAKLLVPYAGAGSEMIGAILAGWPLVLGIENDPSYVQIAHARIRHWVK